MKIKNTGKIKKILLWIGIILILLTVGAIVNYRVVLDKYFDASEAKYDLPDMSKGFIPQGITYDAGSAHIFITGYMSNGKPSPIYGINTATGKTDCKILMNTPDGEKFHGHAGGLSIYKDTLYIAGSTDACVYGFGISKVLDAGQSSGQGGSQSAGPSGAFVNADSMVSLKSANDHIRVSFTSSEEGLLYAGEFHNDPLFKTAESHNISTADGMQKGLLFGFTIDDNGNAVPVKAYSIPDNIQGACFYDHYLFLSHSNGFKPSEIYAYDLDKISSSGNLNVLEKDVPLYVLNTSAAIKITTVPPMSEEIVVINDHLYILHESASNRLRISSWRCLIISA